jgi:hypothetical protein
MNLLDLLPVLALAGGDPNDPQAQYRSLFPVPPGQLGAGALPVPAPAPQPVAQAAPAPPPPQGGNIVEAAIALMQGKPLPGTKTPRKGTKGAKAGKAAPKGPQPLPTNTPITPELLAALQPALASAAPLQQDAQPAMPVGAVPTERELLMQELERVLDSAPDQPNPRALSEAAHAETRAKLGDREKPNATGAKGVLARLGKYGLGVLEGIATSGGGDLADQLGAGARKGVEKARAYIDNTEDSAPYDQEYQRVLQEQAVNAGGDYQAERQDFEQALAKVQARLGEEQLQDARQVQEEVRKEREAARKERDRLSQERLNFQVREASSRAEARDRKHQVDIASLELRAKALANTATDSATRTRNQGLAQQIAALKTQRASVARQLQEIRATQRKVGGDPSATIAALDNAQAQLDDQIMQLSLDMGAPIQPMGGGAAAGQGATQLPRSINLANLPTEVLQALLGGQ